MDRRFGLCVAGYGLAGRVFHAPLIAATPGLDLVGAVSSDPAKVIADHPDTKVFGSLDDALEDPAVDAIVLACPDELHAPLASAALKAGRHVVVDKPFAPTLAEARDVASLASQCGKLVSVFHNRRWDADFLTLRGLIDTGALGDIVQFDAHYDRFKPQSGQRWKDRRAGGIWFDLGAHIVDQALCLFGRPQSVYADITALKPSGEMADYAHVLLRYPQARIILHMSQSVPAHGLRYCVHGTLGSWIKHGLDRQEDQSRAGLKPGEGDWGLDPVEGEFVSTGGERRGVPNRRGDFRQFYAGLRDAYAGTGSNPVATRDALDVMAVLEAGLRSADQRCEVEPDWDHGL